MDKLFVVVRKDLTPSQQAVQSGHAIAQYFVDGGKKWTNETLVILGVKDLTHLESLMSELSNQNINFSYFREPDIGDEATAFACDSFHPKFSKLRLV